MSKRKILALLLAVVMICSLFVSPALAAEDAGEPVAISDTVAPKFTDVEGHWAESAINRWAEEGIVEGYGDGTVNPAGNLKRAELAAILDRLLGLKEKAPANTFSDVAADVWYADAVLKCAEAGIMLGDGMGKANPESYIDRQQTIVMVGRALGVKPASGSSLDRFEDGDTVADWAAPYMIALTDMGILGGLPTGDGYIVAPTVDINRASTFALLDKAIAKYITAPCTVTVDDANKFVVVNSAAEEKGVVTITGKTAGVVIAVGTTDDVVLDKATVGTLKVDAPVDVTINRGSSVTDLDANAAADVTNNGTVTNLNTNADDVTFDGNKPAKVNTAEGVEPAKDSKGNEVTAQPTTSGGSGGGSNTPSVKTADVVVAPSVDQKTDGFGDKVTDSVSVKGTEKTAGEYDVKITARGVKNHTNAANADGHWVGFGIPAEEGNSYWDGATEITAAATRTLEVNGKPYNTVYFSFDTEEEFNAAEKTITVKNNNEVTGTYNVTFDVTFYKATDVIVKAELKNAAGEAHPYNDQFSMAAIGATVAQKDCDLTLTGEIDTAKLNKNTPSDPAEYTYYYLTVGDENIATIANSGISEGNAHDDWVLAVRIWDNTAKELLKTSHVFTLKDAAGRVQDTVTITVDATACSVKGMNKVTFVDADGKVVGNKLTDAENKTAALPTTPSNTEKWYYTGKWFAGETEFTAATEVTESVTVKAQAVEIKTQGVEVRPAGPAGENAAFDYKAEYTKAGMTLKGNEITVKGADLISYLNNGNNATNKTYLEQNVQGTPYVYFGVQMNKVDGATKVTEATKAPDFTGKTAISLAEDSVSGDGTDVLNGQLIKYFPMATDTDPVEFLGTASPAWNRYYLWTDDAGEVKGVTHMLLDLTTTPAQFDVTFQADGKTVDTVKVDYNTAIGELPEVPAKPGYTGAWDGVTAESIFTADATVEAKYTAIEYNVSVDFVEGSDETWTVEGKKGADPAVTSLTLKYEEESGWIWDGWYYDTLDEEGEVVSKELSKLTEITIPAADLPKYAYQSQEGKWIVSFYSSAYLDMNLSILETSADEITKAFTGTGWADGLNANAMASFQTKDGEQVGFDWENMSYDEETGVWTIPTNVVLEAFKYTGFNTAESAEDSYYLTFAIGKPEDTTGMSEDVVVRIGTDTTAKAYNIKLSDMTDKLDNAGNEEDVIFVVMYLGNATRHADEINIYVDWNGVDANKLDEAAGKYKIKFTEANFKPVETTPTTPDQPDTPADTSAVEDDEVVAAPAPVVSSKHDDEVAEEPVLD